MSNEQLEKLVVRLSEKLVVAEDIAKTHESTSSYWFNEYTKAKNELEELKRMQKEAVNG